VIALDLAGHGRSDVSVSGYTKDTEGLLAVVEYAMSLDFVDINKVGLTGHSAGDLDCSNTLKLINVEGSNNHISSWFCSSGTIGALFLTPEYSKNLIWGVSAGKYDELDTVISARAISWIHRGQSRWCRECIRVCRSGRHGRPVVRTRRSD
jgi:pimeloyl-ACP methyl ester carboxylesterase